MNNLIKCDSQIETNAAADLSLLDFFAQVKDTYDTDNNKGVDLVYFTFKKLIIRYHMKY